MSRTFRLILTDCLRWSWNPNSRGGVAASELGSAAIGYAESLWERCSEPGAMIKRPPDPCLEFERLAGHPIADIEGKSWRALPG